MKNLVVVSLLLLSIAGCSKSGGSGGTSTSSAPGKGDTYDLPGETLKGFTIAAPPGAKLSPKGHRADIEVDDIKLHVEKPKSNVDTATIASFKHASEKKPTFKGWVVDTPETILGEDPEGRFGIMSLVVVGDAKLMCSGTLDGPKATRDRAKELETICNSIKAK